MDEQALLSAIETVIDKKLEPVIKLLEKLDTRFDKIDDKLDIIKIDTQVICADANTIMLWTEEQKKD